MWGPEDFRTIPLGNGRGESGSAAIPGTLARDLI